jgi:hypothetical protein
VEVVVEAVLDRRADGDLRAGEDGLHRLGQHVAVSWRIMGQRFGVAAGDEAQAGVGGDAVDRSRRVPSTSIASAALLRTGPMLAATSAPVTAPSNWRMEPSGRVMAGMEKPSGNAAGPSARRGAGSSRGWTSARGRRNARRMTQLRGAIFVDFDT